LILFESYSYSILSVQPQKEQRPPNTTRNGYSLFSPRTTSIEDEDEDEDEDEEEDDSARRRIQ
jgi:hypothetical protein